MRSPSGENQPIGLIGGIGLTEVHVYAQRAAPDGAFSGCPHVHAVVDEGYFVLRGTGRVEFHDLEHGLRTQDLRPGDYVHFPPLIMHRLVSDGDLVILGMMGSAGLAERGEARIYFGREVDEDPAAFERLTGLPGAHGLNGALERRDAAVRAYMGLMDLWQRDRAAYDGELRRFLDLHCRAMAAQRNALSQQVHRGPLAWAQQTLTRLDSLPGRPDTPGDVQINRRGSESAFGMCGVLRPMLTLHPITTAKPRPDRA